MSKRGGSVRPGVMVALAGGLLAAVDSPLPWLKATVDSAALGGGMQSQTANGFDGDGWITLGAGLVVVIVAGIIWMRKRSGKGLAALVAVGGFVAGGVGLYDMLTAKDTIINDAASKVGAGAGYSIEQVKALLRQAFDQGIIKIAPEFGIFIVIVGGVLALIGGLMLMRSKAVPVVEMGSGAGAPWSAPADPTPSSPEPATPYIPGAQTPPMPEPPATPPAP